MNSSKGSNIHISTEYMELDEDRGPRRSVLEEFEKKRRARQIPVTVDDIEVKTHLREVGEPICLFGEGPADRRERLRQILAKLGQFTIKKAKEEEKAELEKDRDPNTTWYHEGPESLREARYWIANYSLKRAKQRIDRAKGYKALPEAVKTANRQELYNKLRSFEINASQIGDRRPVSCCQFSPDCTMIATGSWSGLCKLWNKETLNPIKILSGHQGSVCGMVFHPESTLTQSRSALNLASCGDGGAVNLWSLESEEPIGSLEGHEPHRVSRLAFHPSGRFLATACFDKSWRLWDLEANEEVLYQEGHSKEVYDVAFHPDGSLAATAGLDDFGRVWDLRTGHCIMFMEGHIKEVLSIAFSLNGYQVATGSEDNCVKIWNLRQRSCEYTIPAHTNNVSKVVFDKVNGNFLVTSSYDNTVKVWTYPTWTQIHTLSGHDNKVMCADISSDNQCIVSSSYDRTFKLWTSSKEGLS
ncbi:U4-U6 small nuclear riboprotein factor 60K [Brevipalpus obovatus]|uniref:U4-U6 small nuclear riboprotein factor 60K n=1 Tax=Brevipalpus obovatus TaxID=246614 RepID=UPI003D9E5297